MSNRNSKYTVREAELAKLRNLKRELQYSAELFKRNDDSYRKHKEQLRAQEREAMDDWHNLKQGCTQLRLFK